MQVGVPDKPQMLRPLDFRCMAVLVMTSFSSQAFIARSFQVEKAAKSASAGYLQVSLHQCCFGGEEEDLGGSRRGGGGSRSD